MHLWRLERAQSLGKRAAPRKEEALKEKVAVAAVAAAAAKANVVADAGDGKPPGRLLAPARHLERESAEARGPERLPGAPRGLTLLRLWFGVFFLCSNAASEPLLLLLNILCSSLCGAVLWLRTFFRGRDLPDFFLRVKMILLIPGLRRSGLEIPLLPRIMLSPAAGRSSLSSSSRSSSSSSSSCWMVGWWMVMSGRSLPLSGSWILRFSTTLG